MNKVLLKKDTVTKKILLISHIFPPQGGPRSIRWTYFIRYLSNMGYQFDVLTIGQKNKTAYTGGGMVDALPSSVKIHRVHPGLFHWITREVLPQKEKGINGNGDNAGKNSAIRLRVLLRRLYHNGFSNLFIPDKTAEWIISGAWQLPKLRNQKHHLIISNASPFSSHVLGYIYAGSTGLPWIVDYGDPWTFGSMNEFRSWRQKLNKSIEKRVLRKAHHIVVTTEETKLGFLSAHPFLSDENISIISQGFDPNIYETTPAEKGNLFRIVYTGIFYDQGRNPHAFFTALKNIANLDMEVIIAGDILTHQISIVKELALGNKVIFLGRQSFERCVGLQKGADVLLLIGNASCYQLPGKIFEYFGARKPILVLKNCDHGLAARMVEEQRRGIVVDGTNVDYISKAICELYELKRLNMLDTHFNLSGPSIEKYTWQSSAKKMSDVVGKFC